MTADKPTTDALEILRRRYIGDNSDRLTSLEEERLHAKVARQIHDLRTQAGLSQAELAERIGTTQSAVSRLENADYEGHSLGMLRRVAEALGGTVEVRLRGMAGDVTPYVFRTFMQFLRRERGLTLDELSSETDLPREELAALEQQEGFFPEPRTVRRLSQLYGLSPAKLAALASGAAQPADEVREPVQRFAARSENFSKLSDEETSALRELASVLTKNK